MLDRLLGFVVRTIHDRYIERKKPDPPPSGPVTGVEPYAVFEGRITLNTLAAPALSGAYNFGEYDAETGMYEIEKPDPESEKGIDSVTRLTTFMEDEDAKQQITLRWERERGKIGFSKARKDEIWRVEFYKVADAKEVVVPTVAGSAPHEKNPFGGDPGGGVS